MPVRRLLVAIGLCVALALVSELYGSGIPTLAQVPALIAGALFYAVLYSIVISGLYLASILIAQIGIPGWATFPVAFVILTAVYDYWALSAYTSFQQGSAVLVENHRITAAGRADFELSVLENIVIALAATAVLFWPQATMSRPPND